MCNYSLCSVILFIVLFSGIQAQKPVYLPPSVEAKNIGNQAPAFQPEGNIVYFCSNNTGKYLLYTAKVKDKKLVEVKPVATINSLVTTEGSIRDPFFSFDGKRLYFSANMKDGLGGKDIYYCMVTENGLSEPVNMGKPFNTEKDERSPSVSVDNRKFVFSRINEDADVKINDCATIFATHKKNGEWEKPYILPKAINNGCTAFPQLLFDSKTILFSSVVDESQKGEKDNFDLFFAKELALNFYTNPLPLDFINSEKQQITPYIPSSGDRIYFATGEEKRREIDEPRITYVDIPVHNKPYKHVKVSGKITNLNENPVSAELKVKDINTSELIQLKRNNKKTGIYTIDLVYGINYKIEVLKPHYSYDFFTVATKENPNKSINRDIVLFSEVELLLNVFDIELPDPLEATIQVETNGKTSIPPQTKKIARGRYKIRMELGNEYQIDIEAENFKNHRLNFDLSGLVQFAEFERDVELQPLKEALEIDVTAEQTDENLDAEVVIKNLDRDETIVIKKPNKNGKYIANLRKGDKYEININGPKGYSYANQTVDTKDKSQSKKLDVELKPLTAQTKIELNNIIFETNSADLNASSYKELKRVVRLLNENPDIKIEISAHTDDVGSALYNKRLSNKRAESVVSYLKKAQIKEDRLIAKGYGEKKPLVPNNSDENRQRNRRVELEIIDTEVE